MRIRLKELNGTICVDLDVVPTTLTTRTYVYEKICVKGIELMEGTGLDMIDMTLKDFFKEFTINELANMYKYKIQDNLAKESLKEIIMEKLELPDEASFKLYIELF